MARLVATDGLPVNNVVTLIQVDKLRNDFRSVLQVAIHQHQASTGDRVESCR